MTTDTTGTSSAVDPRPATSDDVAAALRERPFRLDADAADTTHDTTATHRDHDDEGDSGIVTVPVSAILRDPQPAAAPRTMSPPPPPMHRSSTSYAPRSRTGSRVASRVASRVGSMVGGPAFRKMSIHDPPVITAEARTRPSPFLLPQVAFVATLVITAMKTLGGMELEHVPGLTDKRSLLNQLGAKWAWLWTSVVFFFALSRVAPVWSDDRRLRALLRYAGATAFWIFLTQWCWGPSALDRIYVMTGGQCTLPDAIADEVELHPDLVAHFVAHRAQAARTPRACRSHGGVWRGGHDVSGHCLLLVHAFLFLQCEFFGLRGRIADASALADRRVAARVRQAKLAIDALSAIWIVLLAITILYYHSLTELMNGIVLGAWFAGVVYSPAMNQDIQ
ncbi:hypothetical protein GGF31_003582 [Allomyces arbusculus]|nr:hypothetical protein GGF31_003582 [Allomyces arbusculus]